MESIATATRKPEARSKITNGSSLFLLDVNGQHIDGRTTLARRFRDVLDSILSDLGGRDAISEGEYQLARRATAMSVHAELIEAYLAGQAFDKVNLEDYVKLVNGLNRTFNSLGLKRRARDVTPPDPLAYARGAPPRPDCGDTCASRAESTPGPSGHNDAPAAPEST